MSSSRPTTREIADAAGVSQSTVSLALRNHPAIALATRDKVRKVAEKLGYRPNPLVSAWMSHVSSTKKATFRGNIAYIHPAELQGEKDHYLQGILNVAPDFGYVVDSIVEERYAENPHLLAKLFDTRGISAIILHGCMRESLIDGFDWNRYAVVSLEAGHFSRFHTIETDHGRRLSLLLKGLEEEGIRKVGIALEDLSQPLFMADFGSLEVCLPSRMGSEDLAQWVKKEELEALVTDNEAITEKVVDCRVRRIGPVDSEAKARHCALLGHAAVEFLSALITKNETGIPAAPFRLSLV